MIAESVNGASILRVRRGLSIASTSSMLLCQSIPVRKRLRAGFPSDRSRGPLYLAVGGRFRSDPGDPSGLTTRKFLSEETVISTLLSPGDGKNEPLSSSRSA